MTKPIQVHDHEYSWESMIDIEQDIEYALQAAELGGEFAGTIRVRVDFIPDTK